MRRQGIALRLVEEAVKSINKNMLLADAQTMMKQNEMMLELLVEKDNKSAIEFYLKNGWKMEEEIEAMKYGVCWIRGLVNLETK